MPRRTGKENSKPRERSKPAQAEAVLHAGAAQQRGTARAAAVAVEASVPFLEVPRDADWRFARSFAPEGQEAEARDFLATYGFVVFRDVLTAAETRNICDLSERRGEYVRLTQDPWGEDWAELAFSRCERRILTTFPLASSFTRIQA